MFYSSLPLVLALLRLGAHAAQFPAVVEQNRPDVADAFSHLKIESREGFRVPQAVPVGISSQNGAKTAQWSVEEGFSGDYVLDGSVNSVHKRFIDDSSMFAVESEVVFEDDASSNHGVARTGHHHRGGHSGLHSPRPKEFVTQQTFQGQRPKHNRHPEVVYIERDNYHGNSGNIMPFPMNVRGDGPFIDNSDHQNIDVSDDSEYSNYQFELDNSNDAVYFNYVAEPMMSSSSMSRSATSSSASSSAVATPSAPA